MPTPKPTVVCLCGSTRFADAFKEQYRKESLAGKIVLSVGVMVHAGDEPVSGEGPEKERLDELHKRKIDIADEILVLNVGGYIGDSTRGEIEYAHAKGRKIRWLEPPLRGLEQAAAAVLVLLRDGILTDEQRATVSAKVAALKAQLGSS